MRGKGWGHGHSIGTGVFVGAAATQRPLVVFAVGFIVGALVVLTTRTVRNAFDRWMTAKAKKTIRLERVSRSPWRKVGAGTELHESEIPF